MQFAVTFRHMEPTEALKSYARERMERVRKYLPDPISCHVVLSTERHNHRIDVTFQLHNGLAVAGHEITENMYSSIDLCIAKIERQVRKYKGKLEGMRARPHHVVALPWSHSIVSEAFGARSTARPTASRQEHHDAGPHARVQGRQDREVPRPAAVGRRRDRAAEPAARAVPGVLPRHRRPRRGGLQARGRQLRPDRDAGGDDAGARRR